jgi:hypothetical protein
MQFYDRLFSEQFNWWPKLYGLAFDSIDEEEASWASWFKILFEESEVLEVVKGMHTEQALGLDGFTMAFFQIC